MTASDTTWGREVRLAVGAGVVVGMLLGAREGIAMLVANAFADAQHHALAYLLTPIAVWCVLVPILMLPAATVARLLGGATLGTYAGLIAGTGVVLVVLPRLGDGLEQMRASGVSPSASILAMLGVLVVALAGAVGAVVRAAVEWQAQRDPRALRRLLWLAGVSGITATLWTVHFLYGSLDPTVGRRTDLTQTSSPPGAPHVLLVSIDTLRADELGAYGSRLGITPELDRLAADGITFEQAIATAPWTLPALASIMTGLYPHRHGAGAIVNGHDAFGRSGLNAAATTLGEVFAAHGYQTRAIVTNPYLFARAGLAAGFESYENLTYLSEYMLGGRANAGQWLLDLIAPELTVGDRGVEVSDRAIAWLRQVDDRRPFLLWLHYIDSHGPYESPRHSRRKSFRGETVFGAIGAAEQGARSPTPARLRSGEVRLDESGKEAMRALYRAEVAEVDRQVGRVLGALEERGLAEETLVVVVSDHGEEFWDHGGVEHGHTVYDELLRAVWVMRWPGHLPAGRHVENVVSMVDLVPTLGHLVGLGASEETDGVSLVPLMRGEPTKPRFVLAENLLFAEERVALRSDGAKLVRWANGKEEAYDLTHDPGERRDLAGVEAFIAPLRVALDAVDRTASPGTTPIAANDATVRALRALGYVE